MGNVNFKYRGKYEDYLPLAVFINSPHYLFSNPPSRRPKPNEPEFSHSRREARARSGL